MEIMGVEPETATACVVSTETNFGMKKSKARSAIVNNSVTVPGEALSATFADTKIKSLFPPLPPPPIWTLNTEHHFKKSAAVIIAKSMQR
jgi:hypothetical protein